MSFELRWFLHEPLPDGVLSWASNLLGDPKVGSRADYYFVAPEADYLGVKGRGVEGSKPSKIEVKWRTCALAPTQILPNVSGVMEDWLKLSWLPEDMSPEEAIGSLIATNSAGPWIAVNKKRRQWKLAMTGSDEWQMAQGRVDRGLSLEITELTVGKEGWWTLGFDILTADDSEAENLARSGAAWLLDGYDGPSLAAEDSFGYPRLMAVAT